MARTKDPALDGLPSFEAYIDQIDLKKVAETILASKSRPLNNSDFEDAKQIVWEAAERWLIHDLVDLQLDGIEVEYDTFVELPVGPFHTTKRRIKGALDLRGTIRGRLTDTMRHAGKRVAYDWKTAVTRTTLDSDWKDKHRDSHQWEIYSLLEPLQVFSYRCMTRPVQKSPDKPPKCEMADITIEVPADLNGVDNYLAGIFVQRQALMEGGFTSWPTNRPNACGSFGRDCPYINECPGDKGPIPADKSLSYSSAKLFQLCPERYRRHVRDALVEGAEDLEESDATAFGSAVHRGLAELWKQAFEKFGENINGKAII